MSTIKESLGAANKFLLSLYSSGGLPLVLVGLGALALVYPVGEFDVRRWILAGIPLGLGTLTWAAATYVSAQQKRIEAEQRNLLLQGILDIVRSDTSDVVEKKVPLLQQVLNETDFAKALRASSESSLNASVSDESSGQT